MTQLSLYLADVWIVSDSDGFLLEYFLLFKDRLDVVVEWIYTRFTYCDITHAAIKTPIWQSTSKSGCCIQYIMNLDNRYKA